jgi:hypothetical protein
VGLIRPTAWPAHAESVAWARSPPGAHAWDDAVARAPPKLWWLSDGEVLDWSTGGEGWGDGQYLVGGEGAGRRGNDVVVVAGGDGEGSHRGVKGEEDGGPKLKDTE